MAQFDKFSPVADFQRAKSNALSIEGQRQGIARESAAAPIRNQLSQLGLEQAQVSAERGGIQFDQQQVMEKAQIINQTARAIKGLDPSRWDEALASVIPRLQSFGIDTSEFEGLKITPQSLDRIIAETQGFISNPNSISAAARDFSSKTAGLSEADELSARRISLGLDPRAVGSAVQTITDKDTATDVSKTEETIASGKEMGKLKAQFKLKPKVEAAVVTAIAKAKDVAEQGKLARSNELAFNVYNVGMKGLIDAMAGTDTGPFIGWTPALTSNQQIADGAVAALAPVLKQLFRSAGEGIFTDKDQELLLKMVPTRSDTPTSRAAKLSNVDAIVRAKLRTEIQQPGQTQQGESLGVSDQPEGATATGPNGQKIITKNGQWVAQ